MFDHIIDARRCERAVDEYYVTYNVKQVTAKQFVERHSTLFSNTESMGSLRFYMKHVMLLKLASNANSRRIKQHPMWQVRDFALYSVIVLIYFNHKLVILL